MCASQKPISAFSDHRRDGEDAGLPDDVPEGVGVEQDLEIAEADAALHRAVQRREVDA
jgi:hypothetical protein